MRSERRKRKREKKKREREKISKFSTFFGSLAVLK